MAEQDLKVLMDYIRKEEMCVQQENVQNYSCCDCTICYIAYEEKLRKEIKKGDARMSIPFFALQRTTSISEANKAYILSEKDMYQCPSTGYSHFYDVVVEEETESEDVCQFPI